MAATGFNLTYNTPSIDIGSGYAQGIGQAGKSIAESLAGVTNIMSQSQAANDQIDMMTKLKDSQGNPILSQADADALMSKGLPARQAFIGELMGRFHTNYAAQLEQTNKLQQIKATATAELPLKQAEITQQGEEQRKAIETTGAQQRQTEKEKYDRENAPVIINPPKLPAVTEQQKQDEIARRELESRRSIH